MQGCMGPPLGTLPSQASRTGTDELGYRLLAESHNHLAGTEGSEGLTAVTTVVSIP